MSVNNSENNNLTESAITLQPFVVLFVGVIASLLIVIPLLPIGLPNLTFSLSGHAPRIYWYLSRSAGFIGLSILWITMALGLSITNKLARVWPGAPTAFAIHEYSSLLGLVFAMYHGLVLIGDHFVDFSLPHLMLPFSIAYKTFWVGMGQVSFYVWLIVAISFYIRPLIGQKTWRLIHYINFATYTMGFLHGLNSGTDSHTQWAYWYYLISGTSLLALLAYRIYNAVVKKSSLGELVTQHVQNLSRLRITVSLKPLIPKTTGTPVTASPSAQTTLEKHKQTAIATQTAEKHEPESQPPMPTGAPILASAISTPEPKTAAPNWVVKYENNSPENKINVRLFKEPTTRPIEELQKYIENKQTEQVH